MASISSRIRLQVYIRDNYQCLKCGTFDNLSLDHIFPIAKGGTNEIGNLQTLCTGCNSAKGTDIIDYRKWLEYPVIFEQDEPFNWELSYGEMATKYDPKFKRKKKASSIISHKEFMPESEKELMCKNEKSFIIHSGNKCLLYGVLNKNIGYGAEIGQPVYYDTINEKFVLEYAWTKIGYHYDSFKNFVTKNEYEKKKPVIKIKKEPSKDIVAFPEKFNIEKYIQEPEPNFHY